MADTVHEAVAQPVLSLSQHRQNKADRAAVSTAPPADKQAAPAVEKSGTAEKSATSTQETQEQPKKVRATRNAEERVAELRAAGRHQEAEELLSLEEDRKEFERWKASKADREREAEELRTLRASRQNPPAVTAPQPAPEPTKPAAAPSADKPKLKDFLAAPENADKAHDEVVELWEDAVYSWRENKRKAEETAATQNKTVADREQAVRAKYPDYDQYMKGQNFSNTIAKLAPFAIATAAVRLPNGTEALYQLSKNPAEVARIAALDPGEQIVELGVMARSIGTEPPKPPEKPVTQPPVSRTPPPVRSISGISPREDDRTGPPKSLSEHRARKTKAS